MMIRSNISAVLFAASLLVLPACTSITPYQSEQAGYGFSELVQVGGTYQVSFRGNSKTPRDTVKDYLLLRMAETTLERDQDYFTVVEQETDCLITVRTSPTSECTIRRPDEAQFPFYEIEEEPRWFWQQRSRKEYESIAFFTMGTGALPLDGQSSFLAREVTARLSDLDQ